MLQLCVKLLLSLQRGPQYQLHLLPAVVLRVVGHAS